jgi:hypothetical protein
MGSISNALTVDVNDLGTPSTETIVAGRIFATMEALPRSS